MAFAILRATNLCLRGSMVHDMDVGAGSLIFLTAVVLFFSKDVRFNATIYFCLSVCCVIRSLFCPEILFF